MKKIHEGTFQSLDQWDCGNGQTFRELLLRKAVNETKAYATDILFTLAKFPNIMVGCKNFCLFVTFSETHIEEFLNQDQFEQRDCLIHDCHCVWALVWDEEPNFESQRLRLFDVTEETLPQIKANQFPTVDFLRG